MSSNNVARRDFSSALLALSTGFFSAEAQASRRPMYGGEVHLTLPLDLTQVDPHLPTDLTAALLGPCLFDALFALSAQGRPYPALASAMPFDKNGRSYIPLRSGLRFSDGAPLTAKEVVASLRRSQAQTPALNALGKANYNRREPHLVVLPRMSPTRLASLLASPRAAIVPKNFAPSRPVGTGAFRAQQTGTRLLLTRNSLAARGGALLERLEVRSASVAHSLRAFESNRSALGFLGQGLHQRREKVTPFQLSAMGHVIVQAGNAGAQLRRPGLLHAELAKLPGGPFRALGVHRVRSSARPLSAPPLNLIYPQSDPWLSDLAEELNHAWSSSSTTLRKQGLSRAQFEERHKKGDYGLALFGLSSVGISTEDVARQLFQYGARPAPRSGRPPSPDRACRQLNLGLLGELRPHGSIDSSLSLPVAGGRLALEDAHFKKRPR